MSTTIRPEISNNNRYWVERHRYYELKHFCLQYPIWRKAYNALETFSIRAMDFNSYIRDGQSYGNPTAKCAEARLFYKQKMLMVEESAKEADSELFEYIIKGVTEGVSFEKLKLIDGMPCCRETYYDRYSGYSTIRR